MSGPASPGREAASGGDAAPAGTGRGVAELGLVSVAAGWGLTFTLIQDAIQDLPPLAFVAYRFLAAVPLLAVPYAGGLRRLPAKGWLAGAALGLLLVAGYVSQTIGLAHTSASNAGFITGLYVVFTPLLGWLLLRQSVGRWALSCVAVATLGLLLLSGFGGGWRPFGDGLMLLCSLSFAAHILATDWAIRRYAVGPLVAIELAVCGVVALVIAGVSRDLVMPTGWSVWGALLFTSVVASAFAYFVQSYAQTRTSPARTSLILATEPVFAGVFGYWLAGDRIGAVGWLGAALMLAAILALEARPLLGRRRAAGPRPPVTTGAADDPPARAAPGPLRDPQ